MKMLLISMERIRVNVLKNKEMVEEMIVLAINEAQEKIDEESEAINEKITGRPGGLGF